MLRLMLPLLVVLLATLSVAADQPIAWGLTEGQTIPFTVERSLESTLHAGSGDVRFNATETFDLTWSVNDAGSQAAPASIEQDITRIRFQFTAPGGQSNEFDTDSSEPPQGLSMMIAALYRAMVRHNAQFQVAPSGEMTAFEPPEAVLESLKNLPGVATAGEGGDIYQQMLRPAVFQFPAGELEPGQQWTTEVSLPVATPGLGAATLIYTYLGDRELDGQTYAAIDVALTDFLPSDPDGKPTGVEVVESSGEVLFDRQAGVVHSANLRSRLALEIAVGDQPTSGEATQSVVIKAGPIEE